MTVKVGTADRTCPFCKRDDRRSEVAQVDGGHRGGQPTEVFWDGLGRRHEHSPDGYTIASFQCSRDHRWAEITSVNWCPTCPDRYHRPEDTEIVREDVTWL